MSAVFAAWLIFMSEGHPAIPFSSYNECQEARQDLIQAGWDGNRVTCIHGEKK